MPKANDVIDRSYQVRIRLLDKIEEKVESNPDPDALKLLAEALSKVMNG